MSTGTLHTHTHTQFRIHFYTLASLAHVVFSFNFAAIVPGQGKTKSYLHRFKLTDNPTCPCNEGVHTPEHLMYECKLLEVQRSSLKQHIMADGGNWPTPNSELVASYLKSFSRFVKSIDFNKFNIHGTVHRSMTSSNNQRDAA